MLDFLEPAGRQAVEIGPGGGVLTRALLDRGARVAAWELDPEWALELARRIANDRLSIVIGDALELPFERLAAETRVTGNLPFNVATPLIERFLLNGRTTARAAFMVQLEVADRLTAAPGDADYGALSVIVAARAQTRRLGRVPKAGFRPPPRVDAAFVGFELVDPPVPIEDFSAFSATVRAAFALRRKTLRNSLSSAWGRSAAALAVEALELAPTARAEALPLSRFVELHRHRRQSL